MTHYPTRRDVIAASCGAVLCAAIPLAARSAELPLPQTVTIADQAGIGHLVSVVMQRRKLLERSYPRTTFEWRTLGSGAVVREGMISGQVQIGMFAPPPFFVALDRGLKWKILAGAATYNQWLVAKDPNFKTIKDIKAGMQIGVAGLDSFPAVMLAKAAAKQLGDRRALEGNLVSIPPPQGLQLVLSGQMTGVVLPPVGNARALDAGAHLVLSSGDVFSGPVTNNFYVMPEQFYAEHPSFGKSFVQSVVDAIAFVKSNSAEAFAMLAEDQGGTTSGPKLAEWVQQSGASFSPLSYRVLEVGRFMQDAGMIKHAPATLSEIEFQALAGIR